MAVSGIGGFFFRARDPQALAEWYATHLGIGPGLAAADAGPAEPWCWRGQGGPVAFAPMPADSDYFAADRGYMLNLRVDGLDAMVAGLRAAGIPVETRAEWDSPEVGRFARIHDPEGNPIELWEPPAG